MKKVFAILLAVSALGIVISGCGSKEEAPAEPTPAPADGGTTTGG